MEGLTLPNPVPDVADLGRRWGWKLEGQENLPRVEAAVQQGLPVAVYQDAARRDWWKPFGPWPHHFERLETWPKRSDWHALLVISDRVLPAAPSELEQATILYRPPTLTIGIGCREGVSLVELEQAIALLFARHALSTACITALASAASRKAEEALIEYTEERHIPFLTYGLDKLKLVRPMERIGVAQVCEPAAMLAALVRELVIPKTLFRRLALAVARRTTA